jgi:hypothetical protein
LLYRLAVFDLHTRLEGKGRVTCSKANSVFGQLWRSKRNGNALREYEGLSRFNHGDVLR